MNLNKHKSDEKIHAAPKIIEKKRRSNKSARRPRITCPRRPRTRNPFRRSTSKTIEGSFYVSNGTGSSKKIYGEPGILHLEIWESGYRG